MYCKNCGKELPDNARFCDKCNMSVRKKEGKMDMIEELKEERLARKKAYEIEERLKKIKKVKRKRYRAVVLMILGVVAVWGAIVGFSFWNNYKDSTLRDAEPELKATEVPEATPEATEEGDIGSVDQFFAVGLSLIRRKRNLGDLAVLKGEQQIAAVVLGL